MAKAETDPGAPVTRETRDAQALAPALSENTIPT